MKSADIYFNGIFIKTISYNWVNINKTGIEFGITGKQTPIVVLVGSGYAFIQN